MIMIKTSKGIKYILKMKTEKCKIIMILFIFYPIIINAQRPFTVLNAADIPLIEGVWNPIWIITENCNCDSIQVSIDKGFVQRDSLCAFKIKPIGKTPHTVLIEDILDSTYYDSITFRIRDLRIQDVRVFPNGRSRCALEFKSVALVSEDISFLELPYFIEGFTASVLNAEGDSVCFCEWNEGRYFNPEFLNCINNLLSLKPKRGKSHMYYILRIHTIKFTIDGNVFFRRIDADWIFPCPD